MVSITSANSGKVNVTVIDDTGSILLYCVQAELILRKTAHDD
jgi:hypothetical protein